MVDFTVCINFLEVFLTKKKKNYEKLSEEI